MIKSSTLLFIILSVYSLTTSVFASTSIPDIGDSSINRQCTYTETFDDNRLKFEALCKSPIAENNSKKYDLIIDEELFKKVKNKVVDYSLVLESVNKIKEMKLKKDTISIFLSLRYGKDKKPWINIQPQYSIFTQ